MAELGRAALVICLGLSVYACAAGAFAAFKGRRRLSLSARNALIAAFAAAAVAAVVLFSAFVRHDFSFTYVAEHSARRLPTLYTLSAFWGGQEGSLLLWLLILTAYSAAVVLINRRSAPDLVAWVVPVLGGVADLLLVHAGRGLEPVRHTAGAGRRRGPEPELAEPAHAHPPGPALPRLRRADGSLRVRHGLAAREAGDERWIIATRRWTLAAWGFLGVGQLIGAHWAYVEVGWGGYYAWDPVENAAFMPWLAATAFLHSVMVQEKKGMLKIWNMLLVAGGFVLALFGTFLTRSGILSSIHSFAESPLGGWFLGFIALVLAFSLGLIFLRLPLLRTKTKLESLASREASFLYNNLLLVAFCLTILWGVLYPILSEAVTGQTNHVSGPYYNFFLHIFGLPLLLLMGIGPLLAWRKTSLRTLARTWAWPAAVSLVVGAILLALGAGSSIPGLIAYTFSAFVIVSIIVEFVRGTRARKAVVGGSWPSAFSSLVARNRRRYGGYVVHAAIVLLAIGIAGSSAYDTTREARLRPGQSMEIRGYTLTYRKLVQRQSENAREVRALVDVRRGRSRDGTLSAGQNHYPVEGQTSREVAIRSDLVTGEDLYLIAQQIDSDGTVFFKAETLPLVNLIWLAGFIFLGGTLIALWPDAREARRLADRYGYAAARA